MIGMNPDWLCMSPIRRRSPEEWAAAVLLLPETIRSHAARIVWWDFFSGRRVDERWPHLDAYLVEDEIEPEMAELIGAMITLGYTKGQATLRVTRSGDYHARQQAGQSRWAKRGVE